MHRLCLALCFLVLPAVVAFSAEAVFYVSSQGNDAWSGTLDAPNAGGTDGPFATLIRARDAARAARAEANEPVTVRIREGQYFLSQPLSLGPEDSGSDEGVVTYAAYPGEKPQIVGGRLITSFAPGPSGTLVADLPEVRSGEWKFQSLYIDGKRAIRARHPNYDPSDPHRKGFSYVAEDPGAFGYAVGNIHNVGDWLEYDTTIPADGEYRLWVYYGALNKPFGNDNMGGRTMVKVDGGEPVVLENLPDTGSWAADTWKPTATLQLTAGQHVLHWENLKGGGLDLAAFALTDDPDWLPKDTDLPATAEGKHLVVIQAAKFTKSHGPQVSVSFSGTGSKDSFTYAPGDIKPEWARVPGAEVHVFQSGNCRAFMEIGSLDSVDETQHRAKLGGPEVSSLINIGDRYFVANVPDALDAPGEWYLDIAAGKLHLMPPAGLSPQSQVVAPVAGRIIEVIGDPEAEQWMQWIRFEGLSFLGGDYDRNDGVIGYGMGTDGVLYLRDVYHCAVIDCTFTSVGKHAICCVGGANHLISGNDISHTAYGGVMLKDCGNTKVSGNHIRHSGEVYKHHAGIALEGPKALANTVLGNAIHDMTRYGISLKNPGVSNLILCNYIRNTNLETFDTGGIEVTQQDKEFRSHSEIRGNFVADTIGWYAQGDKSVFLSWSIYLDSFAGGYTVEDNICPRSNNGGIMFQGGKDNIVRNNILLDGRVGQGHWSNYIGNSTGLVFEHNIVAWSNKEAPLWAAGKLGPEVITSDSNLFWCPGLTEPKVGYGGRTTWANWVAQGFDRSSLFADPLFTDPAHDDYSLKADSPAWKLGFKKIDTSEMEAAKALCQCEVKPAAEVFFAE